MWVVEIDLISVCGIEIDLISVSGSEMTWFLYRVRKILGFNVWMENKLVFMSGHRNELDLDCRSN